jgi:hypothetical protein
MWPIAADHGVGGHDETGRTRISRRYRSRSDGPRR